MKVPVGEMKLILMTTKKQREGIDHIQAYLTSIQHKNLTTYRVLLPNHPK